MLAVSKVAATEENQGFCGSFPFLTIAYTSCAVIFGHVLASWNPKLLGAAANAELHAAKIRIPSRRMEHTRTNLPLSANAYFRVTLISRRNVKVSVHC